MNILDFILAVPIVYFAYLGIRKGFVKRVMALLGITLAVAISYFYHEEVALFISKYWAHPSIKYLAYIVPFIIVVLIAKFIATVTTKGLKFMALSPINLLLGALFGIAQGVAVSTIIALAVLVFNKIIETPLTALTKDSLLIGYTKAYLVDILDVLAVSL